MNFDKQNKIIATQLNNYWKKILTKYHIFYEVDFKRDLDREKNKNAYYKISSSKEYLEFFYRIVDVINQEDVTLVDENLAYIPKEYIINYSKFKSNEESDDRYSHYLVHKKLPKDIDYLCIDKEFYNRLVYYHFFNHLNKDMQFININNRLSIVEDILKSIKIRGALLSGDTNYYELNEYDNDFDNIDQRSILTSEDNIINIILSLRNKKIIAIDENGKKIVNRVEHIDIYDKLNLLISTKTKFIDTNKNNFLYSQIKLASSDGWVYFKPIEVYFKSIKVLSMYTGDPTIQYFNSKENKWISINNNTCIQSENQVLIRIKMKTGDRILGIYFLNKAETHQDYYKHLYNHIYINNDIKIVKSFDFQNDINIEESDLYEIKNFRHDNKKSYLNYIGKLEVINDSEYDVLLGEEKFNLYDRTIAPTKDTEGKCWLRITRPIDSTTISKIRIKYEILLDNTKNKDYAIQLFFDDNNLNSFWRKLKSKNILINSKEYNRYLSNYNYKLSIMDIYNHKKFVRFRTLNNNKNIYTKYVSRKEFVSSQYLCEVDFLNQELRVNEILETEYSQFNFSSLFYLRLGLTSYKHNSSYPKLLIKKIEFIKKEGYIVFKAFKVEPNKKYRVLVVTDNQDFDLYYLKQGEYKNIKANNSIYTRNMTELSIKIKLSRDSNIFEILVLEIY